MAFKLLDPQPAPRADDLAWDDVGPGLYPGERAVQLTTGLLVAASVDTTWLANGAGKEFWGNARWINRDGSTHLTDTGQHVETEIRHSASAAFIAAIGEEAIMREVLLLLLGESAPDAPWSGEVRGEKSIRQAVKLVLSAGAGDVGALLGLA